MLSVETQKKIEGILLKDNLLDQSTLDRAKTDAQQKEAPLLSFLVEQHLLTDEDLTKVTAEASGLQYVSLLNTTVPENILKLLPRDAAETYMAVPFGEMRGRLGVAMLDPTNIQAVDYLTRKIGRQLTTFLASRASIDRVLSSYHVELASDVKDAISDVDSNDKAQAAKRPEGQENKKLENLVQDAPITRALNAILDSAATTRASDIHIEPHEHDLKIRFRIDGILQDTMTLPKSVEPALISRIKILSNLKIDEHRIPQDGEFQIHVDGHDIDLRIAIAPVVWGEQVVIRLLDKSGTTLTLDSLGFKGRAFKVINEGIHKPHGMTLSTGPTGSGKSTTLYAVVQAIKDITINIVTLEDPVEYKMDGINQIQVNADVGLTFASGLRSILRQDPNVVLVGEIRDSETADLAVQAALTGHTVLSTIHTNSAAGVLPRLLDMGIEPFLIASTVNTVIGQRLVRRLCDKCHTMSPSTPAETESIQKILAGIMAKTEAEAKTAAADLGYDVVPMAGQASYNLARAKGCPNCSGGYKGRIGIYEVFAMTEALEKLVGERATTSAVQTQAVADGMITMQQDGYLKAINGLTTIEEVARVATDG
jgi:type IV pilus assembly protein PilB